MDEVLLDGKTYIPSRKAAAECGYAQDYVGQLARGGQIDAKRVSNQWYIHVPSLQAYKSKAETFKPEPPKYQPDPSVEATLQVEGKEYISAALAAKLTDYNQDYVGQLARAGKVPSKQIGNRWYIERTALINHKQEKDAMLRAVQAESVGLKKPDPVALAKYSSPVPIKRPDPVLMTYHKDEKPLFPELAEDLEEVSLKAQPIVEEEQVPVVVGRSRIPIRVLSTRSITVREETLPVVQERVVTEVPKKVVSVPGKSIFDGLFPTVAFTIVLVVAIGVGVMERDAIYALLYSSESSQTASAAASLEGTQTFLERVLTKELVYIRGK